MVFLYPYYKQPKLLKVSFSNYKQKVQCIVCCQFSHLNVPKGDFDFEKWVKFEENLFCEET